MARNRFIRFGVVLFAIAIGGFLFLDSAYFRVQEIAVDGNKRVSSQEISADSGLMIGIHFFSFKTGQVADAVKKNPWIGRAEISRVVPGKVRISVRERVPVAAVPYHNGFLVVDDEAHVVEFVLVGKLAWPVVTGWEPVETLVGARIDSQAVSAGLRVVPQLTKSIAPRLSEINIAQNGEATIYLMGGVRVLIGQADAQVAKKLRTLESVLEDITKNKIDVAYIDLRYEKPVIKLRIEAPRRPAPGVKS